MPNRTHIADLLNAVGEKKLIAGWVHIRRDHGKLAFFEIRDTTALVQTVYFQSDKNPELNELVASIRTEYILELFGKVKKRPDNMVNADHPTGAIEFEIESIKILSNAKTTPFEINENKRSVGEEIRMQYRYLDLRRQDMQENLRFRAKLISAFRNYLEKNNFVEIETPILTKSSPEGSRDFIVPSRLNPGSFYALPQAPQQFKQLLMIAGFERYFQIARCFRDEDLRNDRQPEFTQLDIEMSFVTQEQILDFCEKMFIEVVSKLCPEKKLNTPFYKITYDEAITKYKTDKPDLRKDKSDQNELAFVWITNFPLFEKTPEGHITYAHNPFAQPHPDDISLLDGNEQDLLKIRSLSYDLVLNGYELSSGSIRIHDPKLQRQILKRFGLSKSEIEEGFGEFLKAFEYGTPPHGGIAPGIDRLLMVLLDESSIREVIAFPKTGDMRDLMLKSPDKVPLSQLKELNLNNIEKR